MDKNTVTNIFRSTKTGNFTAALDIIQQSPPLAVDNAIKIFILTVTACGDCPAGGKVDENGLTLLLNTVLKTISNPSDSQLLSYCQSIFYIFKYFVDKKSFENATGLKSILTTKFLTESSSLKSNAKIKSTFSSLISMFSNSVVILSYSKDESCNEYLTKFAKMILEASVLVNSKIELLKLATRMIKTFHILHISPSQLIEFYQFILELVELEVLLNNLESTFSILETLLNYFLKTNNFQETRLLLCESKLFFEDQTWKHIHAALDAILICCPEYTITDRNFEKWKANIDAFKKQNLVLYNEVIKTIDWPMHYLFKYYQAEITLWCNIPKDNFIKILHITNSIVNDLTALRFKKCDCGPACSITTNHYEAIQFGSPLSRLLKDYLYNHKNFPEEIYTSILNFLEHLLALVQPLKNHNCLKWSIFWSEITINIYNVATALFKQQNSLHKHFFKCVLKYYFKYKEKEPSNFKDTILESSIHSICSQYFQEGDLEATMTFSAFSCLFFPKQRNLAFNNWFLKPKYNVKDQQPDKSHYLEWTLVSILEENKAKLEDFLSSDFAPTKENKVELLCFELIQYKARYPSKLPMMKALKQLSELADSETLATIILQIYDGTVPIHDDMPLVFSAIRNRFEKESNLEENNIVKLGLAVLFYYKYKTLSRDTANKNIEAMERTMMFEKKETIIEGIPKDANDECDIVSAYEDLRLNILTKLLNMLDQSLKYLTLVAKTGLNEFKLADFVHNLCTLVGFEYMVHCFGVKSLQAFETSLIFANMSQNQEKQLVSLSLIIENANTNNSFVRNLISKAENLEMVLSKTNTNNTYNKTLITYYLCKAQAFLYKNNNLAYDACKKAEILFFNSQGKRDIEMLKAKWFVLMFKLTKSCEFKGEEHIKYPMTMKLHEANDIVITYVTKCANFYGAMEPQHQCIFFDTVMELTKAYYLMKLPRDLRCYSKYSIILSQKLVLPLRCVSFLVYLAHSDLLCCKFDHCSIKINGINDIFCLESCRYNFLVSHDVEQKKIEEEGDFEVDRISHRIHEMALDLPTHYRQLSPSSPHMLIEGFKTPSFLTHETSCSCFSCICIEHHILLLEKIRLDALISSYQNQHKITDEFLRGAVMLYKKLKSNYYKQKSVKSISEDLIADFEDNFLETYGNILLDYSFHLERIGFKEKSLTVNLQLLQLLKPKKVQFFNLYTEALSQRASYLIPKSLIKPDAIKIEDDLLTVDEAGDNLVKTPETKRNKVIINVSHHEHEKQSSPKRRLKKVCLFENVSSMEKDLKEETPKPIIKKNNNAFFFTESTPLFGEKYISNTTPKVEIYNDENKSTTVSQNKLKGKIDDNIKQSLLASQSEKSREKNKDESTKGVPSIKKNLMSEWAMPNNSTRTYTRIKKPQQIDMGCDAKKPIQIYSDSRETARKIKTNNSTKDQELFSSTRLETKNKKILSSTIIKSCEVTKNIEFSSTSSEETESKSRIIKVSSSKEKSSANINEANQVLLSDNIKVKKEETSDDSSTDVTKKPIILAGCSAFAIGKKTNKKTSDNCKSSLKSSSRKVTRTKTKVDQKSDLECSNNSVKNDLEKNVDSIDKKLHNVRKKIDLNTAIESPSSNSSSKASSRRKYTKGITLNSTDVKSKVLTEKIKTSTRLRVKEDITKSISPNKDTTSSTNTSSKKTSEAARKFSRNRVL